jgi:hypothetical protein
MENHLPFIIPISGRIVRRVCKEFGMTRVARRWATRTFIFVPLLMLWTITPVEGPARTQIEDFNVAAKSATTRIPGLDIEARLQILVSEPPVGGKRIAALPTYNSPVRWGAGRVDLRGRI